MQKISKGLFTDCVEKDTPAGTYRFAKNIIDSNMLEAIENEDGFVNLGEVAPYTVIGVVPVRNDFVVFSTDNTDSEIGLVTRSGSVLNYTTIYNDPGLNFSTTAPIKGEFRKDVNNDRVVAWIDDINEPRIINIDDTSKLNDVNDLSTFPNVQNPKLTNPVINDTGGSLPTSAIIPITQYQNTDGSTTNWFVHDFTFYINDDSKSVAFNLNDGAVPETISNKSITFTLTGSDTNYDTINIGYILSVDNVLTAYKVGELNNNTTLSITITGSETATDISLDEILTPTATYTNAKAITQLAGRLYLGNLTGFKLPELQSVAMDVRIDYTHSLVNVVSNTGSHKDTLPPTFMPGEVYAFYLGVEFTKGGWGFYHIPGRAAVGTETNTVTNEGMTYKRFQVENTTDNISGYSNMGYWENDGENYPDDPGFVGAVTGDARNTPVRHHRFPLTGHLVDTYYSGNSTVGITQLPALGISVSNVNIPVDLQPMIRRWKIFFAKKEITDSLVQGSDLLQFGADRDGRIQSTGGNWKTDRLGTTIASINRSTIRGHSLDMLFNNKLASPTYIQTHYTLSRSDINDFFSGFRGTGGSLTVSFADTGQTASAVIDFTVPTLTTRGVLRKTKSLSNFVYIPENTIQNTFSTQGGTGEFVGNINNVGTDLNSIGLITHSIYVSLLEQRQFRNFANTSASDSIAEETAYIQYYNLLSAVHNSFQSQELVTTVGYADAADTSLSNISGGDSFLCYMSYLTAAPVVPISTTRGVRMWKGYIGYSRYNFNYRYETAGTIGTFYHGKTDVRTLFSPALTAGESNVNSVIYMTEAHNIIEYTEDYNRMNNFTVGVINHPSIINQTEFPNTIIYSPIQQEESLEFSWRTFKAGDRFVTTKNRGDITNLQGFRNKQLIIHTEDSFFRTRTDIQVQTDSENVFFQSANIFELPPEELIPGYAGTQHKFGCIMTKVGYLFPDDKQGKIFLYNGESLEEISSNGMRAFFRDFMGVPDDNPFTGTGYTGGFDERTNRIIFTKKNGSTSWTVSYNPTKRTWVSFHDYIADCISTTADASLYSLKDNVFYLNNPVPDDTVLKGTYYNGVTYPSFVDQVFNPEPSENKQFAALSWVSECYPVGMVDGQSSTAYDYNSTCTHITLRSPDHCTGRIELARYSELDSFYNTNIRNITRTWYFDDIRDFVIAQGFLYGFYDNYGIDPTKLNTNMEWYDQRKFTDKYVVCRFEFDNLINNRFLFLESEILYRYAR